VAKPIATMLIFMGKRPHILLDGHLRQLDWIGLTMSSFFPNGLKRGMIFIQYRVKTPQPPLGASEVVNVKEHYRGVSLFATIEYFLYVSLEIARHEFDLTNPIHHREALRWMLYARAVTDELITLFNRVRPASVITVQGYCVEGAIARLIADHYAYQVISLENTFYSKRLICEPITGISVNKNSAMTWYYHMQDRNDGLVNDRFLDDLMFRIGNTKLEEHASPKLAFQWPTGKKRILFLGQCYTDSSLLFGSNGRYSTVEVVQTLFNYASQRGVFAMFKLHPKENSGDDTLGRLYNQLSLRRLVAAGLPFGFDNSNGKNDYFAIDSLNTFSTQQLIKDADVIVTINSQGGLEALAFGKEVVLLGGAFYDRLGTTWNAPHLAVLPAILDSILQDGMRLWDSRLVARFLWTYFESYCVKKDVQSLIEAIKARRFNGFYATKSDNLLDRL